MSTVSETVILATPHGNWKAGQEFEVVRKASSTTICMAPSGKRIILPNDKIGLPVTTITKDSVEVGEVEMTVVQMLTNEDELDDILTYLQSEPTITDEAHAKGIIVDLNRRLNAGDKFVLKPGRLTLPKSAPGGIGASMSEAESAVLQALLNGDDEALEHEALKVSPETVEEEPPPELAVDQIWLTDITNGRLPKSGINHIINRYPEDHFPEDIRCDIPAVDPNHYWNPDVLEALIMAHQLRDRALITGLPGTGKTTSVKQFAAWIRQPYMRLGGRGDLESSSFLGYAWADIEEIEGEAHSKMTFKPGMLTQGLDTQGFGYLVTIDEVMKIPAYIQMAMQHLYEKDGYLTIDDMPGTKADKIVHPAPEFLLILTDNVKGTGDNFDKFSATQMQDTSSLDRIGINETLDYLDATDETEMLAKKYPGQSKADIMKLVKFAGLVRNGYRQGSIALTLSPRGLMSILDMVEAGMPTVRSIELAYSNKIADETEAIAVRDMLRTVNIK